MEKDSQGNDVNDVPKKDICIDYSAVRVTKNGK